MPADPIDVARALRSLRRALGASAAGAWRVEGDFLDGLAFEPADDLPDAVVWAFGVATALVPLDRRNLGIVAAVVEGRRVVSLAADLPADAGSGHWLRAFGADRSVAVPIVGEDGTIVGVISVALAGGEPGDDAVEAILRDAASAWFTGA